MPTVFDAHANYGYSLVTVAPVPAASGTSLTVAAGTAVLFPTPPFNCHIWPTNSSPFSSNAEIVRVTNIVGDVFTIVRTQETTAARTVLVGDQIANGMSDKVFTDIENAINALENAATPMLFGVISPVGVVPGLQGQWYKNTLTKEMWSNEDGTVNGWS